MTDMAQVWTRDAEYFADKAYHDYRTTRIIDARDVEKCVRFMEAAERVQDYKAEAKR